MDPDFWEQRWASGLIGFHEGTVNRFLRRFVERLGAPSSVYVPLCGKTVDLDFLAARGFRVTGSELVARAVVDYFAERGEIPEPQREGDAVIYESGSVRIVCGDALALAPDAPFDAIYDRAALIALPEATRSRYASRQKALLSSGGRILLVTLEHDAPSGPPFAVDEAEVERLFGDAFEIHPLAHEDVLAQSQNLTQKGATRVVERAYLLVRR